MERYQPRSKYICDNSKLVLGDFNVDDLNKHFITTANRLLKSEHLEPQDILNSREYLPDQTSKANFNLQYVTYEKG